MRNATMERPSRSTPVDLVTDQWLNMLATVCWAQDQGEKILDQWIQLGHVGREEGLALMNRLASQVRQNQEEMQRWIDSSVKMSLAAYTPPTRSQVEELTRRVEELTRQVEEMSKKH